MCAAANTLSADVFGASLDSNGSLVRVLLVVAATTAALTAAVPASAAPSATAVINEV